MDQNLFLIFIILIIAFVYWYQKNLHKIYKQFGFNKKKKIYKLKKKNKHRKSEKIKKNNQKRSNNKLKKNKIIIKKKKRENLIDNSSEETLSMDTENKENDSNQSENTEFTGSNISLDSITTNEYMTITNKNKKN